MPISTRLFPDLAGAAPGLGVVIDATKPIKLTSKTRDTVVYLESKACIGPECILATDAIAALAIV
jgi:hypothetical protein